MAVKITWANAEKTIIRWVVEGDYTGEDILAAINSYTDMVADMKHKFYILLDLSTATGNAIQVLGRFPELARALPEQEKRAEAIVAVGSSRALDTVTHIFSQVYGGKFVYFTKMDEAWNYLMERHKQETRLNGSG